MFRELFVALDADEDKFGTFNLERSRASAPSFGTSTSPVDEVWAFYTYWEQFSSRMTFAWVDDYDPAEARGVVAGHAIGNRGPHTHLWPGAVGLHTPWETTLLQAV